MKIWMSDTAIDTMKTTLQIWLLTYCDLSAGKNDEMTIGKMIAMLMNIWCKLR